MRRIAFVIALLGINLSLVGTARSQTLYKCVSAKVTSYQQIPCPRSSRLVRTMETVPEPPPTAAQLAERLQKGRRDREESAFLSSLAGTDRMRLSSRSGYQSGNTRSSRHRLGGEHNFGWIKSQRDPQDGCAAAKSKRETAIRNAGLHRTFDLLSHLDADVSDACKRG